MSKAEVTNKFVKNSCYNIKSANYCELQHLLNYKNPQYYTAGVHGWNYDVYELDGVTICTGCRRMPGNPAKGVKEFDSKAAAILSDYNTPYLEKRNQMDALISEFCELNA